MSRYDLAPEIFSKILHVYELTQNLAETAKSVNLTRKVVTRVLKNEKVKIKTSIEHSKKYFCNENFFDTYTEESCYWAGFIAADGCIVTDHHKHAVQIGLKEEDRRHLEKLVEVSSANYPVHDSKNKVHDKIYKSVTLSINSKQWCKALDENFNITPRKSLTLRPPPHTMPEKMAWPFIRGILDGDGSICYSSTNNTWSVFFCGTRLLMEWIQDKLQIDGKITKRKSLSIISVNGDYFRKNIPLIYDSSTELTRLDRKYLKYIKSKDWKRKDRIKKECPETPRDLSERSFLENKNICFQKHIRDTFSRVETSVPLIPSLAGASVRQIDNNAARGIIEKYEWLGTAGRPITCYGLFVRESPDSIAEHLAGVASFGLGPGSRSRYICEPLSTVNETICLERGACVHWAPKNAASFLISHAVKQAHLEHGWSIFFAYADEQAGEIGTVYQACNWLYLGQGVGRISGRPREQYRKPDGKVVTSRAMRKMCGTKKTALELGWEVAGYSINKHKYVWFEGSTRKKSWLRKSCRFPFVSYPKRSLSLSQTHLDNN